MNAGPPARVPLLAIWIAGVALAAIVVARATYVSDLSAFLPAHPTAMQRLLVDQLREGPASRLILCALEGGTAPDRAATTAWMAAKLRGDPAFAAIDDGDALTAEADRRFLFTHRYLLSAAVTPERFSPDGLRRAIEASLEELASPAGLLLKSLLPADPTGETLQILEQMDTASRPRTEDGVFVSADGSRSLLVATTRAEGSDTDAQALALQKIRLAFDAAGGAHGLQLRMSGPGVFAVAARAHIERAAIRLSIASSALVFTLLLIVYRSLGAVVLGLLPVTTGAIAGIAAVALAFGEVHAITLGFGITLIGEAVDYSVYFFIQSAGGATERWERRLWPTMRLGMLTSVCGFASLLPSGFPGLAQLGLYSIAGLLAAALTTRFLLPLLTPPGLRLRDPAPAGRTVAAALARLRRPRLVAAVVLAGSAAVLLAHRAVLWDHELSSLSPVSAADQAFDAALRADLGAADVRDLVVVPGTDLESALRGAEQAGAALQTLLATGVIGGFDNPARFLPSVRTQRARLDSLPAAAALHAAVGAATTGLPLDPSLLAPFVADVERARAAEPLQSRDLQGTSFAAAVASLTLQRGGRWYALLPLHAPAGGDRGIDAAAVRAALQAGGAGAAVVLDLKQEADALYADYLREAVRWSSLGFAGLVLLLAVALRSAARVVRVLLPLLLAVLAVGAALSAAGQPLTILHLVGMLLIVAVGSNYALFFDRRAAGGADAAVFASLALANACTVIAFGLLSFSGVPVLEALGTTVAPGALLALVFCALLSPSRHA
jgi:predicted exporter